MDEIMLALPERPDFIRVARYNFAHAMFSLGMYEPCVAETASLIKEYYEVLGLLVEVVGAYGELPSGQGVRELLHRSTHGP
jgi:hypothetical protein